MNKIAVLLIASILTTHFPAWSQRRLSVSAFIGLGASSFRGPGAAQSSIYHRSSLGIGDIWEQDSMTNPYGKKLFANYVAGVQADVVFLSKWILQLNAEYEYTGARMTIDSVVSPTASINTNGQYTRYYDRISISPCIGRIIFQNSTFKFILHSGLDYTLNISMGERSEYKNELDGKNYSIGGSGGNPEINDFRLSAGMSFLIKKIGIDFNYKHGVANYNKNGAEVYSRLLHVRVLYSFLRRSI
jgi:hypothetical protein